MIPLQSPQEVSWIGRFMGWGSVIMVCGVLASCTQIQLTSHIMKKAGMMGNGCKPAGQGDLKVGNPYTINDIRYVPISSSQGYRSTGIASWYGTDFHGKKTANGECYNMYAMTAAHPILPLPTQVRVTNLENKRSVVLMVNDRGPFARGRLIDLSYAAAKALGMDKQGTAPVLVEAIGGPHHRKPPVQPHKPWLVTAGVPPVASAAPVAAVITAPATTVAQVPTTPAPAPSSGFTYRVTQVSPSSVSRPEVTQSSPPDQATVPKTSNQPLVQTRLYVQTGAFGSASNAQRQARLVAEQFPSVQVVAVENSGRTLHHVRFGPFLSISSADEALAQAVAAGFQTAIVTADPVEQ